MAGKLAEKREELHAKQAALGKIFEAAGPEMDLAKVEALNAFKDTAAKAAEIKRLNDELTALGVAVDSLVETERIGQRIAEEMKDWRQPAGGVTHPTGGAAHTEPPVKSHRPTVHRVENLPRVFGQPRPERHARRR